MRRFVDLHVHSTASDGSSTPAEVICRAEACRLAAVALTDHDTTAGLAAAEAAAADFGKLQFIKGIEVSAKSPSGTMHILGLGIDPGAPSLRQLVCALFRARARRNPQILAKLRKMGLDIDMAAVESVARDFRHNAGGEVIGRVHIAETLRRKGHVRTAHEAFQHYIGFGGPAYVEKERLSPAEVIEAIHDAGGLAVLAHPVQLQCQNDAQLERIVRQLIRDGLDGIEVYHSNHTAGQIELYQALARRFSLGVTGGSDFHGPAKPDVKLGRPRVPIDQIDERLAGRLLRPDARGSGGARK